MQEQTQELVKAKSNKGWMISTIVLLVLLVGFGVFGGLIMAKGNRDTNDLADVRAELEEKNNKIAELEAKIKEADSAQGLNGFDLNGAGMAKTLGLGRVESSTNAETSLTRIYDIKVSKDGKYLYADVGGFTGAAGFRTIVYRALPGTEWKSLGVPRSSISDCKDYSKVALEILMDYGRTDEKCQPDNWKPGDDMVNIEDYYNKTYKEDK